MRPLICVLLLLFLFTPASSRAADRPPQKMEIVSPLGRKRTVKLYSGETIRFHVREVADGIGGIFAPGESLHEVTFLLREWPRVKQDAHAILKGANRRVVRKKAPANQLWGTPPSSFTINGSSMKPGRYLLQATRDGFAPVKIIVHVARFEIVDIDAVLTDRHYRGSFDIRLVDPDENSRSIPLSVESLSEDGRIIDARRDVLLAPIRGKEHIYRTSRRILMSSTEVEAFRSRVARRKKDPLPPRFYDTKSLRIAAGGSIRVSFRNLHAVFPLPLGY